MIEKILVATFYLVFFGGLFIVRMVLHNFAGRDGDWFMVISLLSLALSFHVGYRVGAGHWMRPS